MRADEQHLAQMREQVVAAARELSNELGEPGMPTAANGSAAA